VIAVGFIAARRNDRLARQQEIFLTIPTILKSHTDPTVSSFHSWLFIAEALFSQSLVGTNQHGRIDAEQNDGPCIWAVLEVFLASDVRSAHFQYRPFIHNKVHKGNRQASFQLRNRIGNREEKAEVTINIRERHIFRCNARRKFMFSTEKSSPKVIDTALFGEWHLG
jgi:hypothetical protein